MTETFEVGSVVKMVGHNVAMTVSFNEAEDFVNKGFVICWWFNTVREIQEERFPVAVLFSAED